MKPPANKPTTLRSGKCLILLVCLVAWPATSEAAPRPVNEEELVRAYLASDLMRTQRAAVRAKMKATRVIAPYLPHPELSVRREQSFGESTEFSATVVGASISLEINGRHGLGREAAGLEAAAQGHWRMAQRRAAVCGLRRLVQRAHAGQSAVALAAAGQARLEAIARDLVRLVKAGERAPFDLDRLRLQLEEHGRTLSGRQGQLSAILAELSALTGLKVHKVQAATLTEGSSTGGNEVRLAGVLALDAEGQAEAIRKTAAGRHWIPDIGIYGGYRVDQAPAGSAGHGYEAGLTLNLPFTDAGRVDRARAHARQGTLRARAATMQASRRVRMASLGARAVELRKALASGSLDLDKLGRDVTRRYLTGVSPMSALIDTLKALEQAALQRAAVQAELRAIALETACARGAFKEKAIEKMVLEMKR